MKRILILSAVVLACGATLGAGPLYRVTVDTSGLTGGGYIDLAFDKANSDALSATATIIDFSSIGFTFNNGLNGSLGSVTGSLASPPLVIGNDGGANNYFDQGVTTWGSSFNFLVEFGGPAIGAASPDVSDFLVTLFDGDFIPLDGDTVTGAVADITVGTDGGLTTQHTKVAALAAVPEPATWLTGGLAALALLARRKKPLVARLS
jgi:hypothetical protein